MSMRRDTPDSILVTGAAGFIGSHVVDRLLAEGVQVWGIDNFDPFYERSVKQANLEDARAHLSFMLREGDLRDEAFLAQVFSAGQFDAVIHLAARAGVRPSIHAPAEYFDCNVTGTVRLLETMRRFGVRSLVFGSSSSVYGQRDRPGPFAEDDAADRPLSPYAATKKACEVLCHSYWHLHEIRCYCLRLFTVYGPRQRPDLAIHKFTKAIRAGEPIPVFGDGSSERDYTYIDDVVDAVWMATRQVANGDGPPFEILNIGGNRTVSLAELVRLLGEALDADPTIRQKPPQPGDVPRTWADISRAGELLGYEPSVRIEEGLRRFIAWYRNGGAMVSATQPAMSAARR